MERTVRITKIVLGAALLFEGAFVMAEAATISFYVPLENAAEWAAVGALVWLIGACVAVCGFILTQKKTLWKIIPFLLLVMIFLMWWGGLLTNLNLLGRIFLLPFKGWLIGW